MRRVTLLLFAGSFGCFGQLDSNSVTIQASRNFNTQPDVATLGITVISNSSTGLDEVVAGLQGTGITSANLAGVSTITGTPINSSLPEISLSWSFSLSVPFSALKNTVATLATLQGNAARQSAGQRLEFSVDRSDVSPQLLMAQVCPVQDLVADARTQAKKLTDAAGLGLGPILALADSPAAASQRVDATSYVALSTILFGSVTSFTRVQSSLVSAPASCSLTVKFGLLRN